MVKSHLMPLEYTLEFLHLLICSQKTLVNIDVWLLMVVELINHIMQKLLLIVSHKLTMYESIEAKL